MTIGLAVVAVGAVAGCTASGSTADGPATPAITSGAAAAMPMCETDGPVLAGVPMRPVSAQDVADIEEALGFPLPGRPECGFVDHSGSFQGFPRVVYLNLGADRELTGELTARLVADDWRNLSASGPPTFVRHGVRVQPSYAEASDPTTGLRSMASFVFVMLP